MDEYLDRVIRNFPKGLEAEAAAAGFAAAILELAADGELPWVIRNLIDRAEEYSMRYVEHLMADLFKE
ncbi:hypothetical protein ACWCPQ_14345 [Nocardia sp. NPDC001965]